VSGRLKIIIFGRSTFLDLKVGNPAENINLIPVAQMIYYKFP
jgi:hypothetical protein